MAVQIIQKLKDKSASIGIMGRDYVGRPLGLRVSEAGYAVTGLDIEPDKVKALKVSKSCVA